MQRTKKILDDHDNLDAIVFLNGTEPCVDMGFFYVTELIEGLFEGSMCIVYPDGALEVITSLLEAESLKVVTACDGRQARELLDRTPCDLVVLDLLMPDVDGFAFLHALRADPRVRDLPVLVVTAKDLTREEDEQLRRQASNVLQKSGSFDEDFLRALLSALGLPASGSGPGGPAPGSEPH